MVSINIQPRWKRYATLCHPERSRGMCSLSRPATNAAVLKMNCFIPPGSARRGTGAKRVRAFCSQGQRPTQMETHPTLLRPFPSPLST